MSQINFFMLPDDEREFFELLTARNDTRILGSWKLKRPAAPHESLILVNTTLGYPPELNALDDPEVKVLGGVPRLFEDAFIEWSRSYVTERTLHSGRIYAKIGWLDSAPTNRTFQHWYDALARWIRKHYVRHESGFRVSSSAAQFWRDGNTLSFGTGSAGRTYEPE